LVKLAEKSMTELQQRVLLYILGRENNTNDRTYSWYVRAISNELRVPESTAKWSLKNLREGLLIEAGTLADRGVPLRLTYPGLIVAKELSKNNVKNASKKGDNTI